MGAKNPTELNQNGSLNLKTCSNSHSVEEYLVALMHLNEQIHLMKPDKKRCETLAERIIFEIKLKARQSGNVRFRTCAGVLEDKARSAYDAPDD